jgi:hypothetical protein
MPLTSTARAPDGKLLVSRSATAESCTDGSLSAEANLLIGILGFAAWLLAVRHVLTTESGRRALAIYLRTLARLNPAFGRLDLMGIGEMRLRITDVAFADTSPKKVPVLGRFLDEKGAMVQRHTSIVVRHLEWNNLGDGIYLLAVRDDLGKDVAVAFTDDPAAALCEVAREVTPPGTQGV